MDKIGQSCKQTEIRETCIALQDMAKFVIDREVGRELSQEDILGLLDRAEEVGMVLFEDASRAPAREQPKSYIHLFLWLLLQSISYC